MGCGVDIWWLWGQDPINILTPGMNVESLRRDGLWFSEEVEIIVLFLWDAVVEWEGTAAWSMSGVCSLAMLKLWGCGLLRKAVVSRAALYC